MATTVTIIGMVVGKRENTVNDNHVVNLKVLSTLGNYKAKEKATFDCALWGKLGESIAPMIKEYDKDSNTLGTEVVIIGDLIKAGVNDKGYMELKVKVLEGNITLTKNLVAKDEQSTNNTKTTKKTQSKPKTPVNDIDDDDF